MAEPDRPSRDRYIKRANELRAKAQAARFPEVKEEFLKLAQQYENLADGNARLN